MLINTYNPLGNLPLQKKSNIQHSKNEVGFGEQSRKVLLKTLEYIGNIDKVPNDPTEHIKAVAKASDIEISNKNAKVFGLTIKGILDDPELKIEGKNRLTAYKVYLRYLNDNAPLLENPQKVFPKPEMFSNTIVAHISDYLEKNTQRELELKLKQEAEAAKQPVYEAEEPDEVEEIKPKRHPARTEEAEEAEEAEEVSSRRRPTRTEEAEEGRPRRRPSREETEEVRREHQISRERSKKVQSGGWQNQLLKRENMAWAAAALMGTYIAAQNIGLPQINIPFMPSSERDVAAQVDKTKNINMPDRVQAGSDKIINSVKSGALTLFTLEKNDAHEGDRVTLYGKRFPLYFDQQNQVWVTFLVFPKEAAIKNGKDNYPVYLLRNGTEAKQLGFLEVKGRAPRQNETIKIPTSSSDTNPAKESASSLIITQESFLTPVKGSLVHKYGDELSNGIATDNVMKSNKGSSVIAPARTKVVDVSDDSITLDGGCGLQFTVRGVGANKNLQVGQIVERGSEIAKVSSENGDFNLKFTVNGLPTNFFNGK